MKTISNCSFFLTGYVWLCLFYLLGLPLAAQAQQEVLHSSEIFLKTPAIIDSGVPEGEDGDIHDHTTDPTSNLKLRKARQLPDKATLWNNPAFLNKEDLEINSEDNSSTVARPRSLTIVCAAPIVEEGLESVYASVKAHMPLYIPYRHNKVGIWQGFYYNWGKRHGAIDYGRRGIKKGQDPTFGVYAIADGTVTGVGWKNGAVIM